MDIWTPNYLMRGLGRYLTSIHISGNHLLILDGNGSHVNLTTVDTTHQLGIKLFCHTTHVLSSHWMSPCLVLWKVISPNWQIRFESSKLGESRNMTGICKTEFSAILDLALQTKFTPPACRETFEACGIYPFNPYRVSKWLMPSNSTSTIHTTTNNTTTTTTTTTTTVLSTSNSLTPSNIPLPPTTPIPLSASNIALTTTTSASSPSSNIPNYSPIIYIQIWTHWIM